MKVYTHEFIISRREIREVCLAEIHDYYNRKISPQLPPRHRPLRFVITKTDSMGFHCELDIVVPETDSDSRFVENQTSIFDFRKRTFENTKAFNAVLLIPTGIGAEIGGHCGDGNAVARLIGSACDTLITHPNVLNASDINEMTENTLYVEGSIITRLLLGKIGLQRVRANRLLMLMDKHKESFFNKEIVNAVSSARVTLGLECDVYEMENSAISVSKYSSSGRAIGKIDGIERVFETIEKFKNEYDSVALSTFITVPDDYHRKYFTEDDMVNPWGGIEAMLTHSIAEIFNIPCAHSPMMTSSEVMDIELGIVDPRKAPESASITYLHCILKGLHKAPRIVAYDKGMTLEDVSCIVIPEGCIGVPVLACLENEIPVIAVKENRNNMKNDLQSLKFKHKDLIMVDNYLEAVGVMACLKSGVSPPSVRRPVPRTTLL